ncbi:MAG: hypothetical protein CMH83_11405 [Nocardioides sp.]|nr:hypothetical protein [Nocardioides sp.]
MRTVGWVVLVALFCVEAAAVGLWAVGVGSLTSTWIGWAVLLVVVLAWAALASPQAERGGPVVTPVTKVVVFAGATVVGWLAGYHAFALAVGLGAAVVHALLLVPDVAELRRSVVSAPRR